MWPQPPRKCACADADIVHLAPLHMRARRLGPTSWRVMPAHSQPVPYATGPLPAPVAVAAPETWRGVLVAAAQAAFETAGRVRTADATNPDLERGDFGPDVPMPASVPAGSVQVVWCWLCRLIA